MCRLRALIFAGLCFPLLLCGCGDSGVSLRISNLNIPAEDVTDFYYTYENINYNAFYQRYRFYTDGGRYMFHHETRERPNDYGWTTEEDMTASGTFELSAREWTDVMELLKNGTVSPRRDSAESGSAGPWTYIYWKNDRSLYQKFEFASLQDRVAFEDYCSALASSGR